MTRRVPSQEITVTAGDRDELLATLREARNALVRSAERLKRGCVTRRSLETVVENIDDVAFMLTGDRHLFWGKPPTTP